MNTGHLEEIRISLKHIEALLEYLCRQIVEYLHPWDEPEIPGRKEDSK